MADGWRLIVIASILADTQHSTSQALRVVGFQTVKVSVFSMLSFNMYMSAEKTLEFLSA